MLAIMLEGSIFLQQQELAAKGGPDEKDLQECVAFGPVLGEKGDQLLYRGKDTAEMFNKTAFAIAVLSFCPGGITIFNQHYDGKKFLKQPI